MAYTLWSRLHYRLKCWTIAPKSLAQPYQVNTEMAEKPIQTAIDFMEQSRGYRAIDANSGIGTIIVSCQACQGGLWS